MPELSRFYGIVIAMFYRDHNPPHIHAYGGDRKHPDWSAQFSIRDGSLLDGDAPDVAARLVKDWIRLHRPELLGAWNAVLDGRAPEKIDPLRLR